MNEKSFKIKIFLCIAVCMSFGVCSVRAQTLSKDAALQNSSGNRITIGTPASVTNNKILLPGTLGSQGAILYISSVASTTGTTAWLNPGSNGDVLTLSSGLPVWSAPSGGGGGTGWGLTGNSGTTAGTNFIGTTDAKDWVVKTNSGGTGGERMRVDLEGQVGIGNIQPKVMMDIKGGLATRSGTVSLSNGTNNNVYIGDTSFIRLSGLTGNATINGIRNGYDGKMLTIFNTTPYEVKFADQNTSSVDTTRILNIIGQGGDFTVQDSGLVEMRYDGTMQRWIVTNIRGAISSTSNGLAYFAKTASDSTITTSTLTGCELNVTVQPNVIHTLDGMLYMTSTSSGNPKFNLAFDVPGDFILLKITAIGHNDNGTNTVAGSDIIQADNAASADYQINSNTEMFVWVSGIFINGPSSGTINVKFRSTNNSSQVTMKTGSYLRMIPVGVN
jgi:hypothetical protein